MKKQQNFFSQMGNLTFYSPRNKDAYQESSTAEKSQKFFRNMIGKQSADDLNLTHQNSLSQNVNVRLNTLNEEVSAFDPEQLVTTSTIPEVHGDANAHKGPSDIIKVIGSSKIAKFSSKTFDNKLPSSPHLREFLELKSDKTIREETREYEETGGDIDKVYKAAHHFQNLQTIRDKEEVAKHKLHDDKKNQAFSHLNSVRNDISHIFNHKPAKSLSQTSKILPDIQQMPQPSPKLTKLLSEKGSGQQSPSDSNFGIDIQNRTGAQSFGNILTYSLGPASSFRLLDNTLQDSKFFSSPTNHRRRNMVHNSLQKDIHSVQSPLSKNAYSSSHRSPRDKSPEPSAFLPIFDQSDGSPYAQLKKDLPSVFSNAPTNRQEVIQLGSWLSNALKNIQENNELTGKEKFYKTDEIYNICFNELVRQVSLDCIERGELIMTIWKAYLALSEDIIDDIKEKEEKAEERGEKKCQKIHEMYNDILKAKGIEIESLKQKLNESDILNKELQDTAKTFTQRDRESFEEITKLKEALTKVKKSYNVVQQEHRDLQYKFQKLKKAMDMVEEDNSEEPQGMAIPGLSNLRKRELSQDFSISSSDSEDAGRVPFAFGNVQHKVVTYVDRSVVFEHPNGFTEMEMQTDLVLINEQYDRILATQETIDNFILEEAARVHLMQQAQLMENLAETAPQELQGKEENDKQEEERANESVMRNEAQDALPSEEGRKLKQNGRAGRGTKKGKGRKDNKPNSKLEISIPSQNNTPDVSKDLLKTETSQKTIEAVPEAQEEVTPVIKEQPVEKKEVKETKPIEKKEEAKKNNDKSKSPEKGKDVKKTGKGSTAAPVKETQSAAAKKEEQSKVENTAKNQGAAGNKKPVEPSKPAGKQASPAKGNNTAKVEQKEQKPVEKPVEKHVEKVEESKTDFNDTIITSNFNVEDKSISYLETKRTEVEPAVTDPVKPVPEKVSPPIEEAVGPAQEDEEEVVQVKKIEKKTTIRKVKDASPKVEKQEEEEERPTETEITPIPMETPVQETIQTENNRENLTIQTDAAELVTVENETDPDGKTEMRPELKDASTSPLRSPKKEGGDQTFSGAQTSPELLRLVSKGSLEEVSSEKVEATPNAKGKSFIKLVSQKTIPTALKAEIDENLKNAEMFAEQQEQRIIQLMNMYKVEKKKQEDLTDVNTQLEQQVSQAQTTIAGLQEFIEDLQRRLQASELNKDRLNNVVKNLESKTRIEALNDSKTGSSTSIDVSKMATKKEGWKPTSKKIMNINDPILEASIVPQPNIYRGNANLPAATALARKAYILDKKNNPTQVAIAKVQKAARATGAKSTDVIPVKSVLKQITSFYIEKMQMARENQLIKDQDMATFIYRQFINTYGFQQFALKKYTKFMMSVRKYVNIHRVKVFAKMLCMMEDAVNYTPDETKQYVTGMEFLLTNTSAGLHYPNPEFEKKHFTPFVRAIEYIRIFGEQRMTVDDMVNIKKETDKNKVFDPTGRNPQGLVDIDEFLEIIVSSYRSMMTREKERLEPIFLAGDPTKQGGIIFIEFMMLYRIVEGPMYEDKKMEDAFVGNCDMLVNEEIALSFSKFLAVCFDLDILSEERQDAFIDCSTEEDIEIKFNDLSSRWKQEKSNLTELISRKQAVVPMEVVKEWQYSVEWIEGMLENPGNFTEQKAVLLKHRILCIDITTSTS